MLRLSTESKAEKRSHLSDAERNLVDEMVLAYLFRMNYDTAASAMMAQSPHIRKSESRSQKYRLEDIICSYLASAAVTPAPEPDSHIFHCDCGAAPTSMNSFRQFGHRFRQLVAEFSVLTEEPAQKTLYNRKVTCPRKTDETGRLTTRLRNVQSLSILDVNASSSEAAAHTAGNISDTSITAIDRSNERSSKLCEVQDFDSDSMNRRRKPNHPLHRICSEKSSTIVAESMPNVVDSLINSAFPFICADEINRLLPLNDDEQQFDVDLLSDSLLQGDMWNLYNYPPPAPIDDPVPTAVDKKLDSTNLVQERSADVEKQRDKVKTPPMSSEDDKKRANTLIGDNRNSTIVDFAMEKAMRLQPKTSDNRRQQQQQQKTDVHSTAVDEIITMHDEPLRILRLIDESPSKATNQCNNSISIRDVAAYSERAFPDLRLVLPNQSPSPKKKRRKIDLNVMDTVLDCLHSRRT